MADGIYGLPFDQFQRYRLLAEVVGILEGERPPLSVIEVGGGWPPKISAFLPGRQITVVDQVEAEAEAEGYVRASGTGLPFPDQSFGIAVSIDALEHVPPPEREKFIAELCRVSRGFVVLAAPFASEAVRAADQAVFKFIRAHSGYEHPYLKEHLATALPDQVETMARLDGHGLDVEVLPSGRLDRWLLMMIVYYTLDGDPALKSALPEVMAAYNRAYYPFDICEPAYRHFLIGASEKLGRGWGALHDLVKGESQTPQSPSELAAALEFARVTALAAKDRELAALRAELTAREEEVKALREENAALHEFRDKVHALPLYGFYEQHIKPRIK